MTPIPSLRGLLCVIVMVITLAISAKSGDEDHADIAPSTFKVTSLEFSGNVIIDGGALGRVVHSKESPGSISNFFFRISFKTIGGAPVMFDEQAFHDDVGRIVDFYRTEGFYNATVLPDVRIDTPKQEAHLRFLINEHQRSFVDSVEYKGIDKLPTSVQFEIHKGELIKKGDPYRKVIADGDIRRVIDLFTNSGYPLGHFDALNSGAYRKASTNNVSLVFAYETGHLFKFGDVTVRQDTTRPDIKEYMITRDLEFAKGDVYSRDKKLSSELNLNKLGLFESILLETPQLVDTEKARDIPVEVVYRPRTRQELAPEVNVSDENNAFNIGTGLGYTNRNMLGDARSFNVSATTRLQSLSDWDFNAIFHGKGLRDSSVQGAVELSFQLRQPYFYTKSLSASWTMSASEEKQLGYIEAILRNRISLNNQFAEHTYGSLDWTLEHVNPEILDAGLSSAALLAQLAAEDQPQFNSILTATIQRDKTNDLFSPSEGFFNSLTLEESGILPELLPGLRGSLPFTQYGKAVLYGRWYEDLSATRYTIFAWKAKLGIQEKYGESRASEIDIPLDRKFFAGGSGSIRGWNARELGAMSDPTLVQFGGNYQVEGSAELRVNQFRGMGSFADKLWTVYFVDFGNVWQDVVDFRERQVAVATGFGLRYETLFGPIRIDYGMKAYDPRADAGDQTIFKRKFIGETFSGGVIQFGIGQSF
jgi:outer membrane protein insertion porin family